MVIKTVENFLNVYKIRDTEVLVAVSGGVDSIVLLHVLLKLSKKYRLTIAVAHVNHSLRPESSEEETFVKNLSKTLGVDFFKIKLQPDKRSVGIEEWARNERYLFFRDIMKSHGFSFCATAHTRDDVAETLFMRLIRGSGIFGLRGISPFRQDGIIRPMLSVKKRDLYSFARKNGLNWYEDSSNKKDVFFRNRVRNNIIPALDLVEDGTADDLIAISDSMNTIYELLKPKIDLWKKKYAVVGRYSLFVENIGLLENRVVVSESIASLFRENYIFFDKQSISTVIECYNKKSGEFLLKNGVRIYPGKRFNVVEFKTPPVVESVRLAMNSKVYSSHFSVSCQAIEFKEIKKGDKRYAIIDFSKIKGELYLTKTSNELLFKPLGREKYVGVVDFLKKRGVPKYFRDTVPVVCDSKGQCVWIPFEEISEDVKLTTESKEFLQLSCFAT